jgi:hypothetical protein
MSIGSRLDSEHRRWVAHISILRYGRPPAKPKAVVLATGGTTYCWGIGDVMIHANKWWLSLEDSIHG